MHKTVSANTQHTRPEEHPRPRPIPRHALPSNALDDSLSTQVRATLAHTQSFTDLGGALHNTR